MAQDKRHLTTEQLSTLLDKEVSAEEQAQWQAHLNTCPQCQQELAGLRQMVTLLHALPQPALPRSFVLSVEAAEPVATPLAAAPTPLRPAQRRRPNSYVRGVLRTMSALAAVIGVIFFLSGIIPAGYEGATATSGTVDRSSNAVPSSHSVQNTPAGTKVPAAAKAHTPTPAAVATSGQEVQPRSPDNQHVVPSSGPTFLFFDLSTRAGRVGLGALLVILGLIGYILFRRSHRQYIAP
ncbi:MAG: hypothetical protein JO031_09350 [Ktedonobacteraceae bacterium]|nr:hypothetical protein [Ktedonobacteraceae bacterium]